MLHRARVEEDKREIRQMARHMRPVVQPVTRIVLFHRMQKK